MSARLRDRDADPADLALRLGRVGVVAHLGRQVEGDRQPGLALVEEVAEPPVGLLGGREARVLAHRPEAAAVHRRLDAARERVLTGTAQVAILVEAGGVGRRVEVADDDPRRGLEGVAALRGGPRALARRVSRHRSRAGSGRLPGRTRRPGHALGSPEHDQRIAELDRLADRRPRPARRSRPAVPAARSPSSSPPPRGAAGRPRRPPLPSPPPTRRVPG